MDYAKELVKRDKLIDKVLHGFGGHGLMCRPVKPTKKAALDAGLVRFLRDGLWVVGQEEDWLKEALEVRLIREDRMDLANRLFHFLPTRAELDLMGYDTPLDIYHH